MSAKILIVEHNPDTLLALTIRLETQGFAVLHAVDVTTAIGMTRSQLPDLIVLGSARIQFHDSRLAARRRDQGELERAEASGW